MESIQEKLKDLSCQVVLVSFGHQSGAVQWLEDTKARFPLYLDQKRAIYNLLGLPRSISKAFGMQAMSYYGGALARGDEIPKFFADDDAQQLGGDFMLKKVDDDDGLRFTSLYRSQTSSDRPSVQSLLEVISDQSICTEIEH